MAELAVAWLLARPMVSSVITGVTSVEQLEANVKAADWVLSEADMEAIEAVAHEVSTKGGDVNAQQYASSLRLFADQLGLASGINNISYWNCRIGLLACGYARTKDEAEGLQRSVAEVVK